MISPTTARRRLGAAALATIAVAFVVSPASAASRRPAAECPPGQRDLVAARWELVAIVAPLQELRLLVATEHLRKAFETRPATAARLQDAIRLEVELAEIAGLEGLHAAVWMDRDLDATQLLAERHWRHLEVELDFETAPGASHPVAVVIDVLVRLARLPANAGLVVRHLLGTFAKVTPRVVRALL